MAWRSCGQASGYFRYYRRVVPLRRAVAELHESRDRLMRELRAARELTDQRSAEVMEAHHRVKNCIQTAMSLLSLQAEVYAEREDQRPVAEALDAAAKRLTFIARAHEMLYDHGAGRQSIEMNFYLSDICAGFAAAHALRPVELIVDVEPIELDVQRAVGVALIVVEAVTNAYKHAFSDGRSGVIRVMLRRQGVDHVLLAVADDGSGFTAAAHAQSTGMKILRGFSRNLGGEAEIDGGAGTRVVVKFPL